MITYETGNPHFDGRTVIRLSADGEVLVERNRDDQNHGFRDKTAPGVYREILVLLKQAGRSVSGLPEVFPVPGETLVRLRAITPWETIDLKFWSNQRWRDPILNQLISHFEDLAVEASGGVVRF